MKICMLQKHIVPEWAAEIYIFNCSALVLRHYTGHSLQQKFKSYYKFSGLCLGTSQLYYGIYFRISRPYAAILRVKLQIF